MGRAKRRSAFWTDGPDRGVFLARHGQGHRHSPSTINYRANIDVLKRAGVTDVIAISACGSFRREFYPGTFVLIDQILDRTFARKTSFFGSGCVAHVPFAHPISPDCAPVSPRPLTPRASSSIPAGTYVCMEGPQFSTLAESLLYQAQGADVIGMTAATEAKLAREAEISYAAIAMVTDYDCWHEEHEAVDVASVLKVRQGQCRARQRPGRSRARRFPRRARTLPDPIRSCIGRRHNDAAERSRSRTDG